MRLLTATATLLTTIVWLTSSPALAEVSDSYLPEWLQRRSQLLDARFARKPFEQIGWAPDLETAMKAAAKSGRPIFLFTLDGRMNSGRC